MGRKSLGKVRRAEIIKSFYEVAKKSGLENTSLDKVAETMGVSKALVVHYYPSKDEILIDLNAFILEQHLKLFHSKEFGIIDSREKLSEFIEQLFSRKWNKYFDDGVFYSCYALIYRNDEFKSSFVSYLNSLHHVLRNKLIEAGENKVISNKNLKELTEVIFALIDGAYYYLGLLNPRTKKYKEQLQVYISHTLKLINFN